MKDGADREHFAFEKRHQFSSSDIPGAAVVSQMCSAETEPKGPKKFRNLAPEADLHPIPVPTVFSRPHQLNPQLELLSHASQEAILNSLAPSTLSAYLTGWNCFKAYHGAYQLPFPTLDLISVCNFITHAHLHP
ncbi:hypothetical protein KUCAC02_019257 [Chaenocephalus aceratus]|nr:hypothetical protein KUCAC02_019257 [Chaenocephalus aceratus]